MSKNVPGRKVTLRVEISHSKNLADRYGFSNEAGINFDIVSLDGGTQGDLIATVMSTLRGHLEDLLDTSDQSRTVLGLAQQIADGVVDVPDNDEVEDIPF